MAPSNAYRQMDELIGALKDACADTDEEDSADEAHLESLPEEERVEYTLPTQLSSTSLLESAEASLPWLNPSTFDPSDPIVAQIMAEKAAAEAERTKTKRIEEAKAKLISDSVELVNLAGLTALVDSDLPCLLAAVSASPLCRGLVLSGTGITSQGILDHISPFLADLVSFRVLDFSRCPAVRGCEVEKSLLAAFQSAAQTGIRVEAHRQTP